VFLRRANPSLGELQTLTLELPPARNAVHSIRALSSNFARLSSLTRLNMVVPVYRDESVEIDRRSGGKDIENIKWSLPHVKYLEVSSFEIIAKIFFKCMFFFAVVLYIHLSTGGKPLPSHP
jgi:hypothetical protein